MRANRVRKIESCFHCGWLSVLTSTLLLSVAVPVPHAFAASFTVDQMAAGAITTNNNNFPGCTSESVSLPPTTSSTGAVAVTLTANGSCAPAGTSASSIAAATAGPTILRASSRASTTSPGASVQAGASARASLEDTFTVIGAGTFDFSTSFTGSVSGCGPTTGLQYSLSLTAGNGAGLASLVGGCGQGIFSDSLVQTFTFGAGQIVRLQALISTSAGFRDGTGTSFSDAGNSLHIHLTPTSAGASYITDSGASYAAPVAVPEPTLPVLACLGVAAVWSRRRAHV